MSEKKINQINETNVDKGQKTLKRAIIIFAIIEALVILPVLFCLLTR